MAAQSKARTLGLVVRVTTELPAQADARFRTIGEYAGLTRSEIVGRILRYAAELPVSADMWKAVTAPRTRKHKVFSERNYQIADVESPATA